MRRVLTLATPLLLAFGAGRAAAQSASEYDVKAAFLFNFARFVEWPADSLPKGNVPLRLCVFGKDPFGETLEQVTRNKQVMGRWISIRRVRNIPDLSVCHMIYVGASEDNQLPKVLEAGQAVNALVISDTPKFAERGGMINFVVEGNRVRFEANLDVLAQSKLKISSQLLNLARPAAQRGATK